MTDPRPSRNWRRPATVLLVLLLLSSFPAGGAPIERHTFDGLSYISLDALAAATRGRTLIHGTKDKIELRFNGHVAVFTLFSAVIVVDNVAWRLPYPLRLRAADAFVHNSVLEVFARVAPDALPGYTPMADPSEPDTGPVSEPGSGADRPRDFLKPIEGPNRTQLKNRWAVDTVIIDPGHGGRDPGASGPGKTREKDITLQVARRLRTLVEKELNVRAVLTREDDTYISLGGRARIARKKEGDLFISLHCNASERKQATGHEVYFLSEAKTAEAAAVAERENAVTRFEESNDVESEFDGELKGIAFALFSSQFLRESQELASDVRNAMGEEFRSDADRGVKQANFYVMRGTMGAMPSVLIEMGFISNPTDEKRLRSRSHQQALAKAILDGIAKFKADNEKQFTDAP